MADAGMRTRTFTVGEYLFKEGEMGDAAYLIREGTVKVVKEDGEGHSATLANFKKGDMVGEMALIDDAPRSASAIAVSNTDCIVVMREDLEARLKKSDPVVHRLLKMFSKRFREQAETIAKLSGE